MTTIRLSLPKLAALLLDGADAQAHGSPLAANPYKVSTTDKAGFRHPEPAGYPFMREAWAKGWEHAQAGRYAPSWDASANRAWERGEAPATIHAAAVALGLDHAHHESDLYLRVCPVSRLLVWAYEHPTNVTTFAPSDGSGGLWFDIPFAFDPFWCSRSGTRA